MKNILIIGSSGKIGKHIYNLLINSFSIYTLNQNLDIKSDFQYDFKLMKGDLSGLKKIKFDYIINCAGLLPSSNANKKEFYSVNSNIFDVLYKFLDKKVCFIQLSTISVYGESILERPICEEDKTFPKNTYAKSKLDGEKKCNFFFKNNYIFRIPPVYYDLYDKTLYKRIFKNRLIDFKFSKRDKFHSFCSISTLSYVIKLCVEGKINYGLYHLADRQIISTQRLKKIQNINSLIEIVVPELIFKLILFLLKNLRLKLIENKINEIYFKLFCDNIYSTKKLYSQIDNNNEQLSQ